MSRAAAHPVGFVYDVPHLGIRLKVVGHHTDEFNRQVEDVEPTTDPITQESTPEIESPKPTPEPPPKPEPIPEKKPEPKPQVEVIKTKPKIEPKIEPNHVQWDGYIAKIVGVSMTVFILSIILSTLPRHIVIFLGLCVACFAIDKIVPLVKRKKRRRKK